MVTILVTGCAGFIGSHVCTLLLDKGFHIIGVDNFDSFYNRSAKELNLAKFKNYPAISFYEIDITTGLEAIDVTNISAVIHLAAKAGVRSSIEDPAGYLNVNIVGTQKVHECMHARAINKLIFASSSSVYGNNKKMPFSEADNVDNPITPYAFTKKAGELMNYTFHHLYNIDIVNLGNNKPVKLNELVDIIYAGMGKEKQVKYKPMQAGDVDITFTNISKAGQLFKYKPATDMTAGIKKFIGWFNTRDLNTSDISGSYGYAYAIITE